MKVNAWIAGLQHNTKLLATVINGSEVARSVLKMKALLALKSGFRGSAFACVSLARQRRVGDIAGAENRRIYNALTKLTYRSHMSASLE